MKKTTFRILQRLLRLGSHPASRRFAEDTEGTLMLLTLYLFLIMVFMGGLAIDLMRYEGQRVQVQNTLDRCTLMAANLKQRLDPTSVVHDCIDNANLDNALTSINVTQGFNDRSVEAVAQTEMDALFPSAVGLDSFNLVARSTAVHKLTKIEISLALDISGSMWGARLDALKQSAKDFVSAVLNNDTEKNISISLIPYAGQVNLGPDLRALYQPTPPTYDSPREKFDCIDLPDSAYAQLSLPNLLSASPTTYPMTAFTDTFNTYIKNFNNPWPVQLDIRCKPWAPVILGSQNADALKDAINGLIAEGTTSIHLGMRYALTFLDPASLPLFKAVVPKNSENAGLMPESLAARPYGFDDAESLKVIILMTDGENYEFQALNDGYQSGLSPIYQNIDGDYSIFHEPRAHVKRPSNGTHFIATGHRAGDWTSAPYQRKDTDPPPLQLTWPQVWERLRVSYVARLFYEDAFPGDAEMSYTALRDRFRKVEGAASMNAKMQSLCAMAKQERVVVYSIAFLAPKVGQEQLQACASSASHYFEVNGSNSAAAAGLSQAFNTIAGNINQLQLTE
jgi:hypothetical protein